MYVFIDTYRFSDCHVLILYYVVGVFDKMFKIITNDHISYNTIMDHLIETNACV